MRRDFQVAFILALATIPCGTWIAVAPEYLHLTGTALATTFWGSFFLTAILIILALGLALRAESKTPPTGHRQRMIAIIGMAICGFGFLGFALLLFVERPIGESSAVSKQAGTGSTESVPPFLKETGRFVIQPGEVKKFAVNNANHAYKEIPSEPSIAKSNNKQPPNVLSVFMHDVKVLNENSMAVTLAIDLNIGSKLFFAPIYNFQSNSKYLYVFVPRSSRTFEVVQTISNGYQNIFSIVEAQLGADFQMQGQAGKSKTWELPFSGRVNIYTDDQLDTEQLGRVSTLFKENGASASFFSTDYALGAWQNMRLGLAAPIDLYELRGDPPEIVPVTAAN